MTISNVWTKKIRVMARILLLFTVLASTIAQKPIKSNALENDTLPLQPLLERCFAKLCAKKEQDIACRAPCICAFNSSVECPTDPLSFNSTIIPKLHCRETDLLSFEWDADGNWRNLFYFMEYRSNGSSWQPANVTRGTVGAIRDLSPGVEYQVRVRALSENGEWGPTAIAEWTATREENPDYVPSPVENITLLSLSYTQKLEPAGRANITWTPEPDPGCNYRILYHADATEHLFETVMDVSEKMIIFPMTKLRYSQNYTVKVNSMDKYSYGEGDKVEMIFATASCFEAQNHNLTLCKPPPVANLTVQERWSDEYNELGEPLMNIEMSWAAPKANPSNYSFYVSSKDEQKVLYRGTIPGNLTRYEIQNLKVNQTHSLRTEIWAASPAGESDRSAIIRRPIIIPSSNWPLYAFWGLFTLFMFLCFAGPLCWLYCCRYREPKSKEKEFRRTYIEGFDRSHFETIPSKQQSPHLPRFEPPLDDEYEIAWDRLILGDSLGEGAFGAVRHALLSTGNKTEEVAVKSLKDNPNMDDIRQFKQEIDILRNVGKHPNIVSMLGCSTTGKQILLVVEYCPLGDLHQYLRKAWKEMTASCEEMSDDETVVKYAELLNTSYDSPPNNSPPQTNQIPHIVNNASYGLDLEPDRHNVGPEDLLSFSRQIAIGMEFLSSSRVVHRDLAARNVLVCSDKTVKISDFGLSRDVYEQNIYRKNSGGKIPVKWLALESLTHQEYTTKSDVWSYGILLWEIVTLGASPYPTVPNNCLYNFLKSGHRMERPSTCSQELYQIMRDCWHETPTKRPTFGELRQRIENLMEAEGPHQYLQLDQLHQLFFVESESETELPVQEEGEEEAAEEEEVKKRSSYYHGPNFFGFSNGVPIRSSCQSLHLFHSQT